jgi:hypothetical protein
VAEISKLLWQKVGVATPLVASVLGWSVWRRHHRAMARAGHYKRRLRRLNPQGQLSD